MAKQKITEDFEVFAVIDQFGFIGQDEFNGQILVFSAKEDAVDACDTEAGEQVVKVKGECRYKVKE